MSIPYHADAPGWSERSPLARDFVMRLLRLIEKVFFFHVEPRRNDANQQNVLRKDGLLGGGFKYFLFSPLFGEDSHFD